MLTAAVVSALVALTPEQQVAVVDAARSVLGVPYDLGGRLQRGRGLDCQGLVFFALQPIARCGWRSWSVNPTESVRGELGVPVVGAAPVAAVDVAAALSLLEPGDVLWFLAPMENPAEPSIASLGGVPHWVWHTGLYVGGGRFVVGDHFAGAVVEEELVPYVNAHYAGLFVSRLAAPPRATRCRAHAPMRAPRD